MACDPNDGVLKEVNSENFPEVFKQYKSMDDRLQAIKGQGFTEIFEVGEEIVIKGCRFKVNNFVQEYGFMNLKIIPNK